MSKKVFIDCGANRGQSIDNFIDKWNDWKEYEILSYEGNPRLSSFFNKYNSITNIKFYSKAVWIIDGTVEFYLCNDGDVSSSIIGTKKTGRLDKIPTIVECIDIDRVIREYSKEDYIILKIDVEGAEYELLNHMINKNTFEYVNVLYLEFHNHKVHKTKEDDIRLLEMLKCYENLKVYSETFNHFNFV